MICLISIRYINNYIFQPYISYECNMPIFKINLSRYLYIHYFNRIDTKSLQIAADARYYLGIFPVISRTVEQDSYILSINIIIYYSNYYGLGHLKIKNRYIKNFNLFRRAFLMFNSL